VTSCALLVRLMVDRSCRGGSHSWNEAGVRSRSGGLERLLVSEGSDSSGGDSFGEGFRVERPGGKLEVLHLRPALLLLLTSDDGLDERREWGSVDVVRLLSAGGRPSAGDAEVRLGVAGLKNRVSLNSAGVRGERGGSLLDGGRLTGVDRGSVGGVKTGGVERFRVEELLRV
jgi:hypothetical protein